MHIIRMNPSSRAKVLAVLGPTACGKTSFAVALARRFGGEIVGVDSRQVYKGLDLGSGKDLVEYSSGGQAVPYHMIDVSEPSSEYNLAEFRNDALKAVEGVLARGRLPILAGGSALHMDSLLRGYALPGGPPDQKLRERLRSLDSEGLLAELAALDPSAVPEAKDERSNRSRLIRRVELISSKGSGGLGAGALDADFLTLGVRVDRKEMHRRIEARLDERLAAGMLEEVARLHDAGLSWERLEYFGLEYRHVALHLQGRMSLREMRDSLLAKIRQFAKRQDSWFRKMEREGLSIHWFSPEDRENASKLVTLFLAGGELPALEFRLKDVMYGPPGRNASS